jgi:choline dehydrogenase-like flavoprotein
MDILNANKIANDHILNADICIVGGGAVGIAIAKEFLNTSTTVLLLESGGMSHNDQTQSLYEFENVGHPLRAQEGYVSRNRYLGGSTNSWAGRCAPLNEIDFEYRDWIPNSGWPITKQDLDPYYAKAAALLKLPTYQYCTSNIWEKLIIHHRPDYFDEQIFSPEVFLFAEKPINMRSAYAHELIASHNIQICIHANVTEIEPHNSLKTIENIHVATLGGNKFRVKAGVYILACGGWENTRLLLLSQRHTPNGLGNQHDVVGRYYMEHPKKKRASIEIQSAMLKSPVFLGGQNVEMGSILLGTRFSDQFQRQKKLLNHYLEFSPLYPPGMTEFIDSLKRVLKTRNILESDQHDLLRYSPFIFRWINYFARKGVNLPLPFEQIAITGHMEHAPNRDSRISLSAQKDALGLNRLKVDLRISSEEKAAMIHLHNEMGHWLEQKGLGLLKHDLPDSNSSWPGLTDSSHHMGTTRMSHNPKEGVVNQDCQVHGINNLYIASSSVFSTAGHVNPTLTIMAIALRVADHLKQKVLPFS